MDSNILLAENLEKQRAKAMVEQNAQMIDEIFSDRLSYGHSSGLIDNKSDMIEKILNGVYVYYQIEPKIMSVTFSSQGLLIIMGTVKIDVLLVGKHRIMDSVYLCIYEKEKEGWKFLAHQTGLIKDLI